MEAHQAAWVTQVDENGQRLSVTLWGPFTGYTQGHNYKVTALLLVLSQALSAQGILTWSPSAHGEFHTCIIMCFCFGFGPVSAPVLPLVYFPIALTYSPFGS